MPYYFFGMWEKKCAGVATTIFAQHHVTLPLSTKKPKQNKKHCVLVVQTILSFKN